MPSIRLRPCETCGFLPRRLLRSAILTPCGQGLRSFRLHYAHSAPKSPRLTGGPQNDSGVRSVHEPSGNLQDCPDHAARHIYRHSITSGPQDTYQEPFSQAHLIEKVRIYSRTSLLQQINAYLCFHKRQYMSIANIRLLNQQLVTNEVAADLLSTGRLSGNQWIQGILSYAKSHSRKIGGLLMRKTLRRTRG